MPERGAPKRVTVVDDSTEFVELVREALEDELGCVVAAFTAPNTSADDIAATAPDLVIVDLRLDHREHHAAGWQLMLLMRAHEAVRDVPVVLCSADLAQLREREDELRSMVNVHVLKKPFSLGELYQLARSLLAA
jgi:CheY-like chemotaxis protein